MKTRSITIEKSSINQKAHQAFRGLGMVSGNNSSRLLMDYKELHPESYKKILEYIFGEDGLCVTHLKLEMGCDANTTSGTEPCVKRFKDEPVNLSRGAGFMLARDAKKIRPDLTLDILWWSEPAWIRDSQDVYASRYQWYKEILDTAYYEYQLTFDMVSANQNERAIDGEWIIYLSEHLKAEKNCPYPYSKIKIVAADEDCQWHIAEQMLQDERLMKAIDIIGSHYTSEASREAIYVSDNCEKELLFSEGSPSMGYPKGIARFDAGKGLGQTNGMLDIANRIVAMYPLGKMTGYEYQPVVGAYYKGVTFCHKQLILADTPWNGDYSLEGGFYIAMHFAQFIKRGWKFVDSACFCDGQKSADGHSIVNTCYSYITAVDDTTGDMTTVIVNPTGEDIKYTLYFHDMEAFKKDFYIWETKGAYSPENSEAYKEGYFRLRQHIQLASTDIAQKSTLQINAGAFSVVTISTLDIHNIAFEEKRTNHPLHLPYSDSFSYSADFIKRRGGAPLFTTDEGGAFELMGDVLQQQITEAMRPTEWGGTPNPTTNLGDDTWYDYGVSSFVRLIKDDTTELPSYCGIGARYHLACQGESGYRFIIDSNQVAWLWKNKQLLAQKNLSADKAITSSPASDWLLLTLEVKHSQLKASINRQSIFDLIDFTPLSAGRAALYSSYHKNEFKQLTIYPLEGGNTYIERVDNTDLLFTYEGDWTHNLMGSFSSWNRTCSVGKAGSRLTLPWHGQAIAFTGENTKESIVKLCIYGAASDTKQPKEEIIMEQIITICKTPPREITLYIEENSAISKGMLCIEVLKGEFCLDGCQLYRSSQNASAEAAATFRLSTPSAIGIFTT